MKLESWTFVSFFRRSLNVSVFLECCFSPLTKLISVVTNVPVEHTDGSSSMLAAGEVIHENQASIAAGCTMVPLSFIDS